MLPYRIGRHTIELTSPERVLFPRSKITKGDLADYYQQIAPAMVSHLKNRLLTQQRFPEGITHTGFFQKNIPDSYPSWIKRWQVEKQDGGLVEYAVSNNGATLLYLVQMGLITPHVTLSKIDKIYAPDQLIFDIDPSKDNDFVTVKKIAFLLQEELLNDGLEPWIKLTGSRGVHLLVPLKRRYTFDQVKAYAHAIAERVVATVPQLATLELSKQKRRGRVFIDTLRNSFSATAVAPYAVRALAGAPVAAPITWDELSAIKKATHYTLADMHKRLEKVGDLWADVSKHAVTLPEVK